MGINLAALCVVLALSFRGGSAAAKKVWGVISGADCCVRLLLLYSLGTYLSENTQVATDCYFWLEMKIEAQRVRSASLRSSLVNLVYLLD